MPRPKPPEKLFEHCIRLTDTQWGEFQRRGGIASLRIWLGKNHSVSQWRLARNQSIRAAYAGGTSRAVLALEHQLHVNSIGEIIRTSK